MLLALCTIRLRRTAPEYFFGPIFILSLSFLFTACSARDARPIASNNEVIAVSEKAIDINSASVSELESIPHIGPKLAQKIVEFREANGPFRRVENLMLVPGLSDKRFRQIRSMIKAE